MTTNSRLGPFTALLLLGALACATSAQAQPVYRIVGPDGKVTFSDRAPEATAPGTRNNPAAQPATGTDASALPYELRQVVQRFPVTLYTGSDCAPCDSARKLLTTRGVPFTERTVGTNEDVQALEKLSGKSNLPFATIGGQQLQGFSETEWSQYLDAAGYPKQSQLPANYRRPPAAPLVALKPAQDAPKPTSERPAAAPTRRPAPVPAPGAPTPSNPAGIKF